MKKLLRCRARAGREGASHEHHKSTEEHTSHLHAGSGTCPLLPPPAFHGNSQYNLPTCDSSNLSSSWNHGGSSAPAAPIAMGR